MIVTPIIRPISSRDRVIDRAIITVIITPPEAAEELLCLSSPTADDVIPLPAAPDVYITMYKYRECCSYSQSVRLTA